MQQSGLFGGMLDPVLSTNMMNAVDEDLELSKLLESSGPTGTMLPDGTLGASSISCSPMASTRSSPDNIVALLEMKLSNAEAEAVHLRDKCSKLKADNPGTPGSLPPLPPQSSWNQSSVPPIAIQISKQSTRSMRIPQNIIEIQDVPLEIYERIKRVQAGHISTSSLVMP